jgi:hypothetical protein
VDESSRVMNMDEVVGEDVKMLFLEIKDSLKRKAPIVPL